MKRAAVLIGVKQSGGLTALPAAHAAVEQMRKWLHESQGLADEQIKVVVDDKDAVTVARIKSAVTELAKDEDVEQLVIYFCGHGIVNNQSELWLLSSGPEDPDEAAVNVERSENFARHGVFGHVIFISDACRTAAPELQYQQVGGSSIFKNSGVLRPQERSVDRYFACGLNMPSHQTKIDPKGSFESIYTRTLVSALRGNYLEVVCAGNKDAHPGTRQVHGWWLKKLLTVKVPEEMETAGVPWESWQTPDARINSEPTAWVSELGPEAPQEPEVEGHRVGGEVLGGEADYGESAPGDWSERPRRGGISDLRFEQPESFENFGVWVPEDPALTFTLGEDVHNPLQRLEEIPDASLPEADRSVRKAAARLIAADSKVPSHFESGMGFLIHGATLDRAIAGRGVRIDRSADAAVVWSTAPVTDVLLVFHDGTGTVLPAIAGFICSLTMDEGALVSVSYEPMDPSQRVDEHVKTETDPYRWAAARVMALQLRETRALIAAMSQAGTFRLDVGGPRNPERDPKEAEQLARQIQMAKTYDPSMAVYAAYAYYDLQMTARNLEMAAFLSKDLQMVFFDLALVTGSFSRIGETGDLDQLFYPVYPRFPMLSRGWSLLPDASESEPSALAELRRYVRKSLWTLFEPAGVALIETNLEILEITDERAGFRARTVAAESRPSGVKSPVVHRAERGDDKDQQATAY
jgi:hypothetical protein